MKRKRTTQLQFDLPAHAGVVTPLSRATASRSRHREAPAPKPWQCIVLAVDTARVSGWAIYCSGQLHHHGEVDTTDEALMFELVRHALTDVAHGYPCVLVLEAPYGGSVDVVAGLGAARERWLRAWRMHKQSPARIVRVQPSTWRAAVLGAKWIGAERADVRAHEQRTARALTGLSELGDDEAPAILIGRWASHARAVGRVIGKRATRASLRAWTGAR